MLKDDKAWVTVCECMMRSLLRRDDKAWVTECECWGVSVWWDPFRQGGTSLRRDDKVHGEAISVTCPPLGWFAFPSLQLFIFASLRLCEKKNPLKSALAKPSASPAFPICDSLFLRLCDFARKKIQQKQVQGARNFWEGRWKLRVQFTNEYKVKFKPTTYNQ